MDRRTAHLLTGIMLLGVAFTALPQTISFAQSDPFDGTWQLNVAKSEHKFGRPPRAETLNVQGEKQNRKAPLAGFDAAGSPFTWGFMFIHDSRPPHLSGRATRCCGTYNAAWKFKHSKRIKGEGVYKGHLPD
jgi:hypothetical protein